ncbi:MAG: hypothetical protein ACO3CX_04015, partial [Ilumatobacteraceae bacterium]
MNSNVDRRPNERNSFIVAGLGLVFTVAHAILPSDTVGTGLYAFGALVLVVAAITSARVNHTDKRVWG